MSDKIQRIKGDWVAFMRSGIIVLGQIEYIRKDILGYSEYVTTIGTVREDYVLETRRKALETNE